MKKLLKLLLVFSMFVTIAACSKTTTKETDQEDTEETTEDSDVTREEVYEAKDQVVVTNDNKYHNDFGEITEPATSVPVLMFHYFYDETTETARDNNYYSIQKFEQELQTWKANGYYTLTMEELYDWLQGNIEVPKNSLVLTFDDGYGFTYEMVLPLLEKYDFVGISFEITSEHDDYDYRNSLTNLEMESHTHNMHQGTCEGCEPIKYGAIQCGDIDQAVEDMTTSKQLLNDCIAMAYPFGGYGGHAKEVLQKAGYKMAFTTQFGSVQRGMDPLELPRVRMSTESWFEIY